MFSDLGRILMTLGALLFAAGFLLAFANKIPWLGHLPGDIVIERENFKLYAPITTMVILSIVLSVIFNLLGRWLR
jgi:uncharacterized protein HemY